MGNLRQSMTEEEWDNIGKGKKRMENKQEIVVQERKQKTFVIQAGKNKPFALLGDYMTRCETTGQITIWSKKGECSLASILAVLPATTLVYIDKQ